MVFHEEQSCQILFRSDLKRWTLGLFWIALITNKNTKHNNKMSRHVGSVHDPTSIRIYYRWSGTVGRCCVGAGRRFVFTREVAALLCVKWRHGRHLESVTSNQKSDCVNRWVLTWSTTLSFLTRRKTTRRTTKMSSDMGSVTIEQVRIWSGTDGLAAYSCGRRFIFAQHTTLMRERTSQSHHKFKRQIKNLTTSIDACSLAKFCHYRIWNGISWKSWGRPNKKNKNKTYSDIILI